MGGSGERESVARPARARRTSAILTMDSMCRTAMGTPPVASDSCRSATYTLTILFVSMCDELSSGRSVLA
jgi:hypothetical protein